MRKVIIAYIPVLHEGYMHFLTKHRDADAVYIFDSTLSPEADYLRKDIRALDTETLIHLLNALGFPYVIALQPEEREKIDSEVIVIPDEDVTNALVDRYFSDRSVIREPIFLRWERTNTKKVKRIHPERIITDNEYMNSAFREAQKSSDWWRRVGAAIVRGNEMCVVRYNRHIPSSHQPFVDGDPRITSHRGCDIESSTAIHAEAGAIAEAARKGIALEGAEMYVTDFPCPVCAKQIAESGIVRVYYTRGYAMLDGERVLKNAGVELVEIKIKKREE